MRAIQDSLEGVTVRTFDQVTLEPVRQLNALALDTLVGCARHPAWVGSAWDTALGPNFASLPVAVRAELALAPVTLLEFAGSPIDLNGSSPRQTDPPAFLSRDRAIELAQITLTLAWTVAREDPAATRIIFGITAADVPRILGLDVRDIPRIAERGAGALRPRWSDRPRIWHELLRDPYRPKGFHIAPISLRILQRQLADLRPATGATRLTRPGSP